MGEGRPLRAEFALSTVATVLELLQDMKHCAEEYSQEFLHIQARDRVGICDHIVQ